MEEILQEMKMMEKLPPLEEVEIEEGGNLSAQEEDLKDRLAGIRRELALDLGIVLPPVSIKPVNALPKEGYRIKIKGVVVGEGKVRLGEYLALNKDVKKEIEGEDTVDPIFSHKAKWIKPDKREEAEKAGYLVVDAVEIMATHLREVVKRYPEEFLGREEVKRLLDNIREEYGTLVDEVMNLLTLGEIKRILINLVKEEVSIRNLPTILETLADNATKSKDEHFLTECVREALSRQICQRYQHNNTLHVLTLDHKIEEVIESAVMPSEGDLIERLKTSLVEEVDKVTKLGYHPVVLCSRKVRRHFKKLTSQIVPELAVLAYEEIPPEVEVKTVGMIRI